VRIEIGEIVADSSIQDLFTIPALNGGLALRAPRGDE
jgi:hypothetical protein